VGVVISVWQQQNAGQRRDVATGKPVIGIRVPGPLGPARGMRDFFVTPSEAQNLKTALGITGDAS
jgi:hypothetical protein